MEVVLPHRALLQVTRARPPRRGNWWWKDYCLSNAEYMSGFQVAHIKLSPVYRNIRFSGGLFSLLTVHTNFYFL